MYNLIDITKTGKVDKAEFAQYLNYLVDNKDEIKNKSYY